MVKKYNSIRRIAYAVHRVRILLIGYNLTAQPYSPAPESGCQNSSSFSDVHCNGVHGCLADSWLAAQ
jgi:hypothetical protein